MAKKRGLRLFKLSAIDVERRPAYRIEHRPHTYDLGVKGLPLTNIDRDIEGSPNLQIACTTHIVPVPTGSLREPRTGIPDRFPNLPEDEHIILNV